MGLIRRPEQVVQAVYVIFPGWYECIKSKGIASRRKQTKTKQNQHAHTWKKQNKKPTLCLAVA